MTLVTRPMLMTTLLTGGCLSLSIAVIGQSDEKILSVSFVGEHRFTPALIGPVAPTASRLPAALTSQEKQLTGNAVGVDFTKNLWRRRIEMSYGFRVRFDHLYYETGGAQRQQESVKAWTNDHLFFLTGRFPLHEHHEIRASIGIGLMNGGSDYYMVEIDTLPNGQVLEIGETRDFRYTSNLAALGFASKGFEIGVMVYYCGSGDSFEAANQFVLPTLFLKYRVWDR